MPPARPPSRQITARDLELLAFLAAHRLVEADHARRFLRRAPSTARGRLSALREAGLVTQRHIFHRQPPCYQVTARGLAAIGSRLPVPRVDLHGYGHDLGVAWLWLLARDGAFGELREVIAERELRSRDGPGGRAEPPLAVRVGGVGPRGRERLHYPDLLLVTGHGRRVALELELSDKGRTRRERILSAYGADPRVDAVVYLVEDRRLGDALIASARRLGIESIVRVQSVGLPRRAHSLAGGRVSWRRPPSARHGGEERGAQR